MLAHSPVATRLPVTDLERAKRFYSEKLEMEPVEERPGGLCYRCGGGYFALFESTGTASGDHTQMGWEVANIETTFAALRARGVVFEEYDLPGLKTVNGIVEIEGTIQARVSVRGARGSEIARGTCLASASPCGHERNGFARNAPSERSDERSPVDTALAQLGDAFMSRTVNVNGTTVHNVRGASGPSVVLLHGFRRTGQLTPKWSTRLAAFDVYMWDQCYSMEQSLRID